MVVYWRHSGHTPTGMEMLLWLGVVPVGVNGAGFMLRSHFNNGVSRALNTDISIAGHPAATEKTETQQPQQLQQGCAVAAVGLHTWQGVATAQWQPFGRAPELPPLSASLRDSNGLPIQVCAVDDLPLQDVLEQIGTGEQWPPVEQRALALLAPVLEELLRNVHARLPVHEKREEVVVAGLRRNTNAPQPRMLTVELLAPYTWGNSMRTHVATWLSACALQVGFDASQFKANVVPVSDASALWAHLQHTVSSLPENEKYWHVLVAAESFIDANLLMQWEMSGTLATAKNSDGNTPGEGAAGVVLASRAAIAKTDAWLTAPHIIELAQNDTALRPAAQRRQLSALVGQWWSTLGIAQEHMRFTVHDAALHGEQMLSAAAAATAINPDVDVIQNGFSVRASSGEIGLALPLAQLALAYIKFQQHPDAVLVQSSLNAGAHCFSLITPLPDLPHAPSGVYA